MMPLPLAYLGQEYDDLAGMEGMEGMLGGIANVISADSEMSAGGGLRGSESWRIL